ncbi:hypothetical protein GCM10010191_90580 [Actinomadura vinacea]|uniref:Uncharacterized protein n=1 Tax=Actinomadura vinacea TaxID=115336 RepID=A0ABP5XJM4_9ACTN
MDVVEAPVPDGAWYPAARALTTRLKASGLAVVVLGYGAVRVWNPAGAPDPDDKRGQLMSHGLQQEVRCGRRADGRLWWFWVWSGPTRDAPPELEPLCPLEDVEMAAGLIVKVLAVPFAEASHEVV